MGSTTTSMQDVKRMSAGAPDLRLARPDMNLIKKKLPTPICKKSCSQMWWNAQWISMSARDPPVCSIQDSDCTLTYKNIQWRYQCPTSHFHLPASYIAAWLCRGLLYLFASPSKHPFFGSSWVFFFIEVLELAALDYLWQGLPWRLIQQRLPIRSNFLLPAATSRDSGFVYEM